MGQEIERKFTVHHERWQVFKASEGLQAEGFRQGYMADGKATVRVRVAGNKAWLTIKGMTRNVTRQEFEYTIPVDDAEEMLETLCRKPLIEKQRYCYQAGAYTWEVDEFFGDNAGLIVAEIELPDQNASFDRPDWVHEDVSNDPRYFNSNLAKVPFNQWLNT